MRFSTHSLRLRLLAAVNAAIVLLLGIFLIVDYRREIAQRVAEKHIALQEETKTLLPAVMRISPYGQQAVQRYIDDVCGRMQEASSPGHHIALRIGDTVFQAVAHNRASPEIFQAMETAAGEPTHRTTLGDEELVVGSSRQGDTTVYVSEYMSNIRRAAESQILTRVPRIVLLAIVTAVVVNVVFLRMAARPLEQLVSTVRRIGAGELGIRTGPFASKEFDYLAEAINSMSASLAKTGEERNCEMARARRIQEAVLPQGEDFSGLEVATFYTPAEEVAGDYYDIVRLDDGSWVICVADVTGHGVPAAMSAMMLKTFLLHATEHEVESAKILAFVNHRMSTICRSENLASMFVARYDPAGMTLDYASAGHEIGLLVGEDGTVRKLAATGFFLAVAEDATWDSQRLSVQEHDRLYLPTDGITEAFSPSREMFGRKRFAELVARERKHSLSESVSEIGSVVQAHRGGEPASDDMTLLAVEFGPRST
jgi:serine phosphatase RsbU (regulator of sigma subunit)